MRQDPVSSKPPAPADPTGLRENDEWRTIMDPSNGGRITFEVIGAETNGALVRMRGHLPPHSSGPPSHRHRAFSESFTVLAGRLTVVVAGRVERLGPGASATVPKGVAHTFRNDGDEEVVAITEVRPSAHFEEFLRALYGLGRDGRLDPINFALAARLGESLPAGPPVPIARALVGVLAWIGDRLGRDGAFPEYTRPPTTAVADHSTEHPTAT